MPQKRYRSEEIIAKLRQADVLLGAGKKVPEVVKALGIHEVTYYRWRKEFGGLSISQAERSETPDRIPRWPTSSYSSDNVYRPNARGQRCGPRWTWAGTSSPTFRDSYLRRRTKVARN